MLLCALDIETSGLNTETDRITEIGAVVWDTDRNAPIEIMNKLVNASTALTPEIVAITGIIQEDLLTFGIEPKLALVMLGSLMTMCRAAVGHNALLFDKPFLEAEFKRYGMQLPAMPWIDTCADLPYPESIKTRKLTHLAAEHGFLNPFAHRALSDVLTMMKIFSHYNADEVLATSLLPSVKLVAHVKKPWTDTAIEGSKESDKAKARGYRFEGSTKRWVKIVKQNRVAEETAHVEFVVTEEKWAG